MNEISFYLYVGLILHFLGDYVFQNDWMAQNKTKSSYAAFVHALVYSVPFSLIVSIHALLIIFLTHLLIDRFRLASYWTNSRFYSSGKDKPEYISFWILVIIDNTIHIVINSISIIASKLFS